MKTTIPTKVVLLFTTLLVAAACGPKQVRGEAPLVQVSSWRIEGTDLTMAVRIRNVNDEELPVNGLEFSVMLEDTELISYQGPESMVVSANGFETVNLEMTASEEGTRLLEALQAGDRESLPYDFSGSVTTSGGKPMRFQREGHIYTVPGRPGQFR